MEEHNQLFKKKPKRVKKPLPLGTLIKYKTFLFEYICQSKVVSFCK